MTDRLAYTPSEAAQALGITTRALTGIIKRNGFAFTEIAPGGRPGDRSFNRWILTVAQLDTILRAQARQFAPEPVAEPSAEAYAAMSPDGISRLRRSRKPRRQGPN